MVNFEEHKLSRLQTVLAQNKYITMSPEKHALRQNWVGILVTLRGETMWRDGNIYTQYLHSTMCCIQGCSL